MGLRSDPPGIPGRYMVQHHRPETIPRLCQHKHVEGVETEINLFSGLEGRDDIDMYKAPIELTWQSGLEDLLKLEAGLIVKACVDVGVNVDKDELVKLLQGDRDSYNQGYKDGYDAAIAKIMEALEQ